MMKTLLPLVGVVAIVLGCGKGGGSYEPKPLKKPPTATVSAGGEKSLFPLSVGNQWVYLVAGQGVNDNGQVIDIAGELTWKVVQVTPEGGGVRAVIDIYSGAKKTDRQTWLVNSKGIYQLSIGGTKPLTFNPPMPSITFPAEKGRTFKWSGVGPRPTTPGQTSQVSTIVGAKEVDVVSGPPISAIAVETMGSYGGDLGTSESTTYFAPNVGIVRYVHQVRGKRPSNFVLKLKSHRVNASK